MTLTQPAKITTPVIVVMQPRVVLLEAAGLVEVLRRVNVDIGFARYGVSHVGAGPQVVSSTGLTITDLGPLPAALPDACWVVLCGSADLPLGEGERDIAQEAACEARIIAWLARVIRPGIKLVSICAWALLAARAGLLDGYACTTHHACMANLTRHAPRARVLENRLFVEDGDRLTSAGMTAGIDLTLHLVARSAGYTAALAAARYMVVYMRRAGHDPQVSPWLEGRNHIHPAVHRAQDAVMANPAHDWSVGELARKAGASPRHLSRLFSQQSGMSIAAYVSHIRVALAHDLVTGTGLDLESVAERAGFASGRQLRRAWSRHHERPPAALRRMA